MILTDACPGLHEDQVLEHDPYRKAGIHLRLRGDMLFAKTEKDPFSQWRLERDQESGFPSDHATSSRLWSGPRSGVVST
jgi:hypothetical protein